MANALTWRVEEKGLRELGEALRKLSREMSLKIAAQATGAAGKIVKEEAKRIVRSQSYDTGSLYDAVIVKKIPRSQSEYTSAHIVTVRGRGKKAQRAREAAKGKKVARVSYGHHLEFGTKNMTAEPFLKPGFDRSAGRAKDIMISKLRVRDREGQQMIEGVVFTLLEPLVDGRVTAGNMLQDPDLPQLPAITYEITSRNNEATTCGTDDVSTDDVAVEVQFVAKTNGAAIALRDAGIAAMMAHIPSPRRGYGYSAKHEAMNVHVQVFEFIFYQSSAAP